MPARKKVLAKRGSTAVADVQAAIAAQLATVDNQVSATASPTIKIDQDTGNQFEIPSVGTVPAPIGMVIVAFISSNSWWEKPFNASDQAPPDCFAASANINDLVPSESSPQPQAESCEVCPLNQFGSSGAGKACKNQRILAVLPPDQPEDNIHIIRVSPTGLKSFDNYIRAIKMKHNTISLGVETSFNIVASGRGYTLAFNANEAKVIDDSALISAYFARQEEAMQLLMQEPDYSSREADAPRRKAAPRRSTTTRKKTAAKRSSRSA